MRRASMILAALAVVALGFTAVADQPAEVEEKPMTWSQAAIDDPEALYVELCASCHGVDGKGNGPVAEALAGPVPDLTLLTREHEGVYPSEDVSKAISGEFRVVAHGTLEMPVWGRAFEDVRPDHKPARRYLLSRQRVGDLTEYLKTLQVP